MSTQRITSTPDAAATIQYERRSSDDRVANALEEYASAVDAGQPISKQSLLDKYADVAVELAGCLDSLEFIHHVAPQLGQPSVGGDCENSDSIHPLATLGDFRIVREIGRGGMGVVYEAEQLSLGRRVALKVLPFAAMLGDQQLKRFQNEARAAATLEHPNIVAIHSVGTDRGVHYYAMQLVEGRNLVEVIEQMRNSECGVRNPSSPPPPSAGEGLGEGAALDTTVAALPTIPDANSPEHFRAIARLGIQAAEALDHAHAQGIIHRDVKPANLLVDATGKLWVTDFGLARLEADAGMTMTGDLLGTLAYMSPEQALAKRVVVDHRTDLYSLGVTLYELIAGQKPYDGTDRQELLRKIAFEEPRRLRQVNDRIPEDLETIVAKAIEKSQDDRYDTAQELADDLDRFLSDQPIRAKPPSWRQQVGKWSRRHVGIVWTALAAAVVVSAVLSASTALVATLYREAEMQREVAEQEYQRAESALVQANEDRHLAIQQRNIAQLSQYSADISAGQADLEQENYGALFRKLVNHIPREGEIDRRGWEWDYLMSMAHPEDRTMDQCAGSNRPTVGGVYATWSPDGKFIAAGGWVWDAETGKCFRRFSPKLTNWSHSGSAWSPDSQQFAWTANEVEAEIFVWNSQTDLVYPLRGHSQGIRAVAWSPDGRRIASGGGDNTVRIWDLASRTTVRTIHFEDLVHDVSWSPDGAMLAVGTNGWEVVDPDSGDRIAGNAPESANDNHHYVSWHPDGSQIAYCTDRRWIVINCKDWSRAHAAMHGVVSNSGSIAWSPDGTRLAMVHGLKALITDLDQNEPATLVVGHDSSLISVCWAPDGRRLLTADESGIIKVWNTNRHDRLPKIDTYGPLDWNVDTDLLQVVKRPTYALPKQTYDVPPKAGEWPARIVGKLNGSLEQWDVVAGKLVSVKTPNVDTPFTWLPGYNSVAVYAASEDGPTVTIRDAATGEVRSIWQGRADQTLREFFWSRDGSVMAFNTASAEREGVVEFWDVERGETISQWSRPQGHLTLPDFDWTSDGGRVAVTQYQSDRAYVIDVASGKEIYRHETGADGLVWSPDDRILAIVTVGGKLEIVDTEQRRLVVRCWPHSSRIHTVCWHPDGQRLATCSSDGTVKIISSVDGASLLSFSFPEGPVYRMCWSPDGQTLAAAVLGGPIHFVSRLGAEQFSPHGTRSAELAMAYYRRALPLSGPIDREALRRFLGLAPDELGFWQLRGNAHSYLGEFDKAAAEFAKTISPQIAFSVGAAHDYGYALLGAGNRDAYSRLYAKVVKEVADTAHDAEKRHLAWHCNWTVNPLVDTAQVIELARAGLDEEDVMQGYRRLTLAGALFRDGQHDEASQMLDTYIDDLQLEDYPTSRRLLAIALYFRVLIRHELGHSSLAREALAEANRIVDRLPKPDRDLLDLVELNALREEAEAKLGVPEDADAGFLQ